ncbi:MAG: arsenite efflux transporter metallochaperone ArsD [Firmicutes bacterium]|nr:arsenite efflux transporter metallochaperone ArsD [Bacillota bacterium]
MENLKTNAGCGCNIVCSCNEISVVGELLVKNLNIDFLYLDLNTCERCMATDETLQKALAVLSGVFDTLGYQVKLNSVNITSKELAQKYRFLSSPTIRVNGVDICSEVKESDCADCGDLCGDSVDCRIFVYEGKEYEQPPVAMIVDGILKAVYGEKPGVDKPYTLPDNLDKFFSGKNNCCDSGCGCNNTQSNSNEQFTKTMFIYEPAMCCPTGLSGSAVDPELLRVASVLDTLAKNGVRVNRYNLTDGLQEFINNADVFERLDDEGNAVLPIVVVDGKIVISKRYPSNEEFLKLLELPDGLLDKYTLLKEIKDLGCGCGCGSSCC